MCFQEEAVLLQRTLDPLGIICFGDCAMAGLVSISVTSLLGMPFHSKLHVFEDHQAGPAEDVHVQGTQGRSSMTRL